MAQEPEQNRKIFIGGLSYKTSEEGLRGFYAQWGELLDAVVMTDKSTGNSRGFGFVTYSHAGMVDDAMRNRPHTIDGRTVQPKRAVPREDSNHPGANVTVNKIFIGGIRDRPITKNDLELYFSAYGTVQDCVIMTEKETGKPRGFAFVEFDDYDPVDQIILRRFHEINGVKIDVKKALPRDGASGETPRGGGRGGGAGTQRGGRGGSGGRGRGGREGGRGGMIGDESGYGGRQGRGYGNENDPAPQGWNQSQTLGWNPNVADGGMAPKSYDQGYGVSYPGLGPLQTQPLLQPQQPQQQQQLFQPQFQQQTSGYNTFGHDFGQNYGQTQGGGAMKGSMGVAGYGAPGGRQTPYPANNYGR